MQRKLLFAISHAVGCDLDMETWGERLRQRARELGLTDVDVARRLGLAQGRYSAYVNGAREPDLKLFVRICQALGTTPDDILGVSPSPMQEDATLFEVLASLRQLDNDGLALVSALIKTVAAHRYKLAAQGAERLPSDGPAERENRPVTE